MYDDSIILSYFEKNYAEATTLHNVILRYNWWTHFCLIVIWVNWIYKLYSRLLSLECSFKPLIKVWPAKYPYNDAKTDEPIYACVCVWYRFYTRVVQDSPPGDLAWKIIQLEVSTYKHTQRNE